MHLDAFRCISRFESQDLVQKRFGNSSAAKGLEALLGEARAAEAQPRHRPPPATQRRNDATHLALRSSKMPLMPLSSIVHICQY
jgi:hypothetical protein